MKTEWWMVIVAWSAVFGTMIGIIIHEWRKTPEQRQQDREKIQRRKEESKALKRQPTQDKRPAPRYGCMYALASGFLSSFLSLLGILVLILVLFILMDT